MLGEKVEPLEMKPGATKKFDYEYERAKAWQVCSSLSSRFRENVWLKFIGAEPKPIIAAFSRKSSAIGQPPRIIVEVQDNLNTHQASSFYENLPPASSLLVDEAV